MKKLGQEMKWEGGIERERSKTDAGERERNALSENEMRVIGREGR